MTTRKQGAEYRLESLIKDAQRSNSSSVYNELEKMILKEGMVSVIEAIADIAGNNGWDRAYKHLDRAFRAASIEGGRKW